MLHMRIIFREGFVVKGLETQYKENSAKVKAADRWLFKQQIARFIPILTIENQPNGLTPLGIPEHLLRDRERQFDSDAARFAEEFREQQALLETTNNEIAEKKRKMEERRAREKIERERKLQEALELERKWKEKLKNQAVGRLLYFIRGACKIREFRSSNWDRYYKSRGFPNIWEELPLYLPLRKTDDACLNKVYTELRSLRHSDPWTVPSDWHVYNIVIQVQIDIIRRRENSRQRQYWRGEHEPRRGNPGPQAPTPPDPEPVAPPDPEPATPPKQDLPWCMQAPGRRCIR